MSSKVPSSSTDSRSPDGSPLISIVIPTHNRSELLKLAVQSIRSQSFDDWEIVIVDDGSRQAVSTGDLIDCVDFRVRVIRNDSPLGVAAARMCGYEAARGAFIAQIDDDDLFRADALPEIISALRSQPEADVVFIGIESFGAEAEAANRNQKKAKEAALLRARARRRGDMIIFDERLFEALLEGVPACFQKPVFRRAILHSMLPLSSNDWPESAWAIEAAARGLKCVLIDKPLYQWRREGQSFFSSANNKTPMQDHHVAMKKRLYEQLAPQLSSRHAGLIARSYGNVLFDRCADLSVGRTDFWHDFVLSLRLSPRGSHLILLLKYVVGHSPTHPSD